MKNLVIFGILFLENQIVLQICDCNKEQFLWIFIELRAKLPPTVLHS